MTTLLLALLLTAPDPAPDPWPCAGRLGRGTYGAGEMAFWPDDPARPRSEHDTLPGRWQFRHEAEPDVPIGLDDALGRRVRLDPPRWKPVPWGTAEREGLVPGRVVVLGGMPPGRFRAAVARAADAPPDPFLRGLVHTGLADRRYRARLLARRLLVLHGEASIPALREGLESDDLEVRDMSRWALEEVRTGDPD